MKTAVIIIPTIGKPELHDCIASCLNQTYENLKIRIVVDGVKYKSNVDRIINRYSFNNKLEIDVLTDNVGSGGWYGHRVYAAYSLLVNQDYVFYLDEDNILEPNHVESMISLCEKNNLKWCYSLRNIVSENKEFICQDNCESLGKWIPYTNYAHIDTSCYCLSLDVAQRYSSAIFGKWGADRNFYNTLNHYEHNYHTTGLYTLNYRLGGNEGSVKKEFFEHGNSIVTDKYNGNFPWRLNAN